MAKLTRSARRVLKHKRVRKTVSGTPDQPRLCIFRSNQHIHAQIIDDEAGKTLASSSTVKLKLKGSSVANATKVGEDIAKNAKAAKVSKVVFDRSGYIYTGKVEALAKAARKSGLKF